MADPFATNLGSGPDALAAHLDKIATLLEDRVGKKGVEAAEKIGSKFQAVRETIEKMSGSLRSFAAIAGVAGVIGTAAMERFVAVANPAIMDQFRMATMQVSGVLGQMFAPILQSVTDGVREFATWLYNLSPAMKATIVAVSVGAAITVAAIGAVTAAVTVLGIALSVFSAGAVLVIGVIVTEIAAFLGVMGGAAAAGVYFGQSMEGLKKTLYEVWGVVKVVGKAIWDSIRPSLLAVVEAAKQLWAELQPAFEAMKNAVAGAVVVFRMMRKVVADAVQALVGADGMGSAFNYVAKAITIAANAMEGFIDRTAMAIIILRKLNDLRNNPLNAGNAFEDMKAQFREYFEQKQKIREDMKKKGPDDQPPLFGLQARFSGVSEAKDEFQMASLRASAGLQDPARLAAEIARQQLEEQRRTNELLERRGGGPPHNPGARP